MKELMRRGHSAAFLTLEQKKKEANKSTVVRMQKYRQRIYDDKERHDKLLEKDRKRKKDATSFNVETEAQKIQRREKERVKKRKQREKSKTAISCPHEVEVQSLRKKLQTKERKTKKLYNESSTLRINVKTLCEKLHTKDRKTPQRQVLSTPLCTTPTSSKEPVSRVIWKELTPRTKNKVSRSLSLKRPSGLSQHIRKEIGLNISKAVTSKSTKKSDMCTLVEEFFNRPDVTKICPDKKKSIKNPNNKNEQVQIHYRMGFLSILFNQFHAESNVDCSMSSFKRYVPFYIRKPNPSDWGTCLCITCLNPELKLQRLIDLKLFHHTDLESQMSEEHYPQLMNLLNDMLLNDDKDITYLKWDKVLNDMKTNSGKKSQSISRKVSITVDFVTFIENFKVELETVKDHLYRVHQQFKAYKKARIEAMNGNTAVTIHLDWSENARLRQAQEERSAYYHEEQVSVHAMHSWHNEKEVSFASLSNETDHGAAAIWASVLPVLKDIITESVTHLNIITDSPVTQYRNKSIFWFVKSFVEAHKVSVKWIYLEAGHGKGIPDGVGATTKRAISNIISNNPTLPIYTVDDLFDAGLDDYLPSIIILEHKRLDIDRFANEIPKELIPAPETLKIHEINIMINDNGLTTLSYKKNSSEQIEKQFEIIKEKRSIKRKAVVNINEIQEKPINKKCATAAQPKVVTSTINRAGFSFDKVKFNEIEVGEWVVVIYEEEHFLGLIEEKTTSGCLAHTCCLLVRCLEKPYGIGEPQKLEKESNIACYDEYFKAPVVPELIKVGRALMYKYQVELSNL